MEGWKARLEAARAVVNPLLTRSTAPTSQGTAAVAQWAASLQAQLDAFHRDPRTVRDADELLRLALHQGEGSMTISILQNVVIMDIIIMPP